MDAPPHCGEPLDAGAAARQEIRIGEIQEQIRLLTGRRSGVDGIVFVADSAPNRLRANAESLRNLRENLAEYNLKLHEVPHVIQILLAYLVITQSKREAAAAAGA